MSGIDISQFDKLYIIILWKLILASYIKIDSCKINKFKDTFIYKQPLIVNPSSKY
jgi:hypothetical protein